MKIYHVNARPSYCYDGCCDWGEGFYITEELAQYRRRSLLAENDTGTRFDVVEIEVVEAIPWTE